jgi:hypothetical protein
MDNDLIVYKVRPSYFDKYAKDDLIFTSGVGLSMFLYYTTYPCTVSTVSRRTHECITTSS